VHKVNIEDVICVLIIYAWRSQLDGSVHQDSSPPPLEPQGGQRPKMWALCVAAARNKMRTPQRHHKLVPSLATSSAKSVDYFNPTCPLKRPCNSLANVCAPTRPYNPSTDRNQQFCD
jgi:hypothetical protein